VGLSADPIIIELKPGSGAPTDPGGSTGTGSGDTGATTPAPAVVPEVTNLASSGTSATITGHAGAGSTVTVSDGATTLGSVVADSNGNWTMNATVANTAQHHLTEVATATDGTTTSSSGTTSFGTYNQALTGTSGNDVLIGANQDKMTGGAGSDTFVYNYNTGMQTVQDFSATDDKVAISSRMFADFDHMMAHATQNGSDVQIAFNQWNVLTLHNTDLHSLAASNFEFFSADAGWPASSGGATDPGGSTGSTPPAPGAILPEVTNATGSGTTATISGHADAGSTVTVSDGATKLGSVVADSQGHWTMNATVANTAQHHLTEVATSLDGTTNGSAGTANFGTYNQVLTGGSGNDVLVGMNQDTLSGGAGSDTFVINYNTGMQTIQDFSATDDKIAISSREYADFDHVMAHATQNGADVQIAFNQWNVVTLHNTDLHTLTASNFTFI
jgi:hypothetical protein